MTITNRQLASAAWLLVFLAVLLWKPDLRKALLRLVGTALQRTLLLAVLMLTIWTWGCILILERYGLWDSSHVTKTWIWIFTAGIVSLFKVASEDDPVGSLKEAAAKNYKISVALTFFVNLYPMSFWAEFILLPMATFVVLIQVFSEIKSKQDNQYQVVKAVADRILLVLGLGVLVAALYSFLGDVHGFFSWKTLRKFLVPIELSLMSLPLLYYMALLATYERLMIRVSVWTREDPSIGPLVRALILLRCHINLRRLVFWSRRLPGIDLQSTSKLLSSFRFSGPSEPGPPPETFQDRTFGEPPSNDMKRLAGPDEDGLELYGSTEDTYLSPLFGCKVVEASYGFQNGKLYSVNCYLDGRRAFNEGRYELQALYGPPSFDAKNARLLRWRWSEPKFEIILTYDDKHDRVTVAAFQGD